MPKHIIVIITHILFIQIIFFLFPNSLRCSASKFDVNIVLITIDTLRADHLSCYGYERETSPHIDKIAERSYVFKNVIAPSSWTSPSMVSLFTSVYPINHGVVHGFVKDKQIVNQEVFSDKLITLAEILQSRGYTTFGVASNLHLCEEYGFARGFDYFKCLPFYPAPAVNKTVALWEKEIKKAEKFFLWLHYFDPHHPYSPRKPWINAYTSEDLTRELGLYGKSKEELFSLIPKFNQKTEALSNLIALYDSEINFVDSYIGRIIKKYGFDRNTFLIITSDHGEEFLDHGKLDHGHNLHRETITVPLIVKLPQQKTGQIISQQVSLLDIMPSILNVLDIPSSEQILGKPLLAPNDHVRKLPDRMFFSELQKGNNNMKAILTDEWKYIHNHKGTIEKLYDWVKSILFEDWRFLFSYEDPVEGLYNRKKDPYEQQNLIKENPSVSATLKGQLLQWVNNAHNYPAEKITVSPSQELLEKLKALGYISNKNSSQ
jgi:arylsulfatase A-like enzyme